MKKIILTAILLPLSATVFSQVGVGTTTPEPSAALDVSATDKGFLMPRMTTAQRSAIAAPTAGLQVYDTTTNTTWYYNGADWVEVVGTSLWENDATNTTTKLRYLSDGSTVRPNGNKVSFTDEGHLLIGRYDENNINVAGAYPENRRIVVMDSISDPLIDGQHTGMGTYGSTSVNIFSKQYGTQGVFAPSYNIYANSDDAPHSTNNRTSLVRYSNSTSHGTSIRNATFLYHSTSSYARGSSIGLFPNRDIKLFAGKDYVAGLTPNLKLDATNGNVGINVENINESAQLQVESTTKGFLMPRMTSAQRTAIPTPAAGLQVYDTTTNKVMLWDGTVWQPLITSTKFVNGTDPLDAVYNVTGGSVGIGTLTPDNNTYLQLGNRMKFTTSGEFFWGASANQGKLSWDTTEARINTEGTNDLVIGTNGAFLRTIQLKQNSGNVAVGYNTVPTTPAVKLDVNGYIKVGSSDTTGDTAPVAGMIRFNTSTSKFQGYDGTAWVNLN